MENVIDGKATFVKRVIDCKAMSQSNAEAETFAEKVLEWPGEA